MSKILIIAEKPNVAAEIAAALGVPRKANSYENNELIISNCLGHLLNIVVPEWRNKNLELPLIPDIFPLEPSKGKEEQYNLLAKLINRADVSIVVNACDADREGESIFRRVFDYTGSTKPVKRMWIQSTTKQGYIQAFQNMKDGVEYRNLYDAAQSRAEADWLLGMNGSRVLQSQVGRVMTPTLAMVVDRFLENKNFKSSDYWEIGGIFQVKAGQYEARLLNSDDDKIAKFNDKEKAQDVLKILQSQSLFSVEDECKQSLSYAPYLFDSTELQKQANKKFKYSADKTLSIMQSLYEKYKAMTYPRSDFNALPEDYLPTINETINHLGSLTEYQHIVSEMKHNQLIQQNKRVFDNSRIDSHYAIVPTGFIKDTSWEEEIPLSKISSDELKQILPTEEYNVFNMIVLRTLAAFYPPAEYAITTRKTKTGEYAFKSSGKVLIKQGWLAVYGGIEEQDTDKKKRDEQNAHLPIIEANEQAKVQQINLHDLKTTAPPLMTESDLLQAMKTAGRDIEDKALSNLMKEIKGIGTSATRPDTIGKLKKECIDGSPPYLILDKNHLIPSERAIDLIRHLRQVFPQFTDPITTAEWEYTLLKVEKGECSKDEFMQGIKQFVKDGILLLKHQPNILTDEKLCLCPSCKQSDLVMSQKEWICAQCAFKLKKQIAGRIMSREELFELATTGETKSPLTGFLNKEKKPFSTRLKLVTDNENGGLKVIFHFDKYEVTDTGLTCPCCKQQTLLDKGKALNCECGFILWKTVASKELSEKVIETLVNKGQTAAMSGFKSQVGKAFSASLYIDVENKKVSMKYAK